MQGLRVDLYAVARSVWDRARVLDRDGDPVVVIRHEDFIRLGAALDRVRGRQEEDDAAELLAHTGD